MKIISHRGNINGKVLEKENKPSYLDCAIFSKIEVETDIRWIDNKFYLGHDNPDYIINEEWILKRKEYIWFHCKNLEAAQKLETLSKDIKYFCHTNDPFISTSTNHFWVHDFTSNLNNQCIIPLLDEIDIKNFNNKIVYAVCTDYVNFCKYNLRQKGLC